MSIRPKPGISSMWIRYLNLVPFDVWAALIAYTAALCAMIIDPPLEIILTVILLGIAVSSFEFATINASGNNERTFLHRSDACRC